MSAVDKISVLTLYRFHCKNQPRPSFRGVLAVHIEQYTTVDARTAEL